MKKFLVVTREVFLQEYRVKAKNKQEAIQKVRDGQGDPILRHFRYSHTLHPDLWTVKEAGESDIFQAER